MTIFHFKAALDIGINIQGHVESIFIVGYVAHVCTFWKILQVIWEFAHSMDNAHYSISSISMHVSSDIYIAHSSDQHRNSQLFAATSVMLYAW